MVLTMEAILEIDKIAGRIKDRHGKKDATGFEIDACPICKGDLRYTICGYNGHVHMVCETKDCIQVME